MRSWSVWCAAVMLGGLLGWVSGAWHDRRSPESPLPLMEVAAAPPSRLSQPAEELPPSLPADPPAAKATPASGHGNAVRSVIDRELPQASADERDIWFEQLKDLPPGIVEDLLSVRKQFREMVPPLTPSITPAPLGSMVPQAKLPTADASWSESIKAIEQLRHVTLHNLANAETPGYRRLDSQVFSDSGHHGLRWGGTRLDLRSGPIVETNRLADVALTGPGWFAVETIDGVVLTRHGSFTVREGRLALPINAGETAPVVPPIHITEGVHRIEITDLGDVLGWSADGEGFQELGRLQVAILSDTAQAAWDAGQAPNRADLAFVRLGAGGIAPLTRASLEQSNVRIEQERDRLRWIDDWLERVGRVSEPPR